MNTPRQDAKFKRVTEVKSYIVPFDELPRPIFWFNDQFDAGTWSGLHCHKNWGELVFMRSGYMVICTEQGNFLVPPHMSVWIPPNHVHEWYIPQPSVDNGLFIVRRALPPGERFNRLQALKITPLVRELILELVKQPHEYEDGLVSRMVEMVLELLPTMDEVVEPFTMPHDHRLVELSTQLLSAPDTTNTIRDWCDQLGMSERTLARLFQQQTGISFGRWRQKIRLHYARSLFDKGENVTNVTLSCGYQSISTFITLFKKKFGQTPGQYIADLNRR